jgi:hypothetical protein
LSMIRFRPSLHKLVHHLIRRDPHPVQLAMLSLFGWAGSRIERKLNGTEMGIVRREKR